MTRTHGWESYRQQPFWYDLRITGRDKKSGQLVFGRDIILPINHAADWRYIFQSKQTQINKDVNCENTTKIDRNDRLGDKVMTKNGSVYKYKTPFRGPYEIVQTWTNGTVTLQTGTVTHRINIRNIKPYNYADVE